MTNDSTKLARTEQIMTRLAPVDVRQLRMLMTRDRLSLSEFIRRAIQAYDLMYSRDE